MKLVPIYRYPVTDSDGNRRIMVTPFRIHDTDMPYQIQLRADADHLLTNGETSAVIVNLDPADVSAWREIPAAGETAAETEAEI